MAFDDPVLNHLVDRAIAQNLDLRDAALRIFEARAQRCTVRADLYPQLAQDADYSFNKTSRSGGVFGSGAFPGAFDDTTDQWSLGLSGTWEIDVFGRLRRLVEAANADIDVSDEDYRDTLVLLLSDVATNYVDARTFQQRIKISEENIAIQQRSLDLTQKRFDAEIIGELDVRQAEAEVEGTRSGIPALQIGYQQAVNRLSVLLGCPPGEVDPLLAEPAPIPDSPNDVAIGIPAELLRRRPDIRRAERQLAAQTARIGGAVGELYPKFTILGSFSLDAQDFSKLWDYNAIGTSIGPRMQWNILNFGKFRCNVWVQEARTEQRAIQYQSTVLRAAEEVDNALVNYVREKTRRGHLEKALAANRRAVEISQQRYEGGDVSFQRVLDSQRSRLVTQDQAAVSQANATIALIQLYRALGGGWDLPVEIETAEPAPLEPPLPAPEEIDPPLPNALPE
jgi:multidrug efflux system outer membrane protein